MGKVAKSSVRFTDESGHSTLESIASADKFNRWMYNVITPFCHGETMEVGGGIGNISQCFLSAGNNLTVTELQEEYCQVIRDKFGDNKHLKQVLSMDVVDPEFNQKYQHLFEKFDAVFALNVVEHIENDSLAIRNCKKLLKSNGNLIILVPAFQSLYNSFDKALGHFKRYKKKDLVELFEKNDLKVIHKRYFNFVGTLGWWVSGKILRKEVVPEGQMKLYNFFVPVIKLIDNVTRGFVGLSVIVVGRKK